MPLGFGRQGFSGPARIGAGLGVAYVNRRGQGKRYFGKHSPVLPLAADALPKRGMSEAVLGFPLPTGFRPKIATLISAGGDELKIFPIGDRVLINRKSRNRNDVRLRSEEHTSELQSPDHLVC